MNNETYDPFAPKNNARQAFGRDKPLGYIIEGDICDDPTEIQQRNFDTDAPEFWDDERKQPKMMAVLKLQTTLREDADDDGIRALYCRGGKATGPGGGRTLKEAIIAAAQTAGAPIRKGGHLKVKYVEDGEPPKRGFNPPKLYAAIYTPPTAVDPFAQARNLSADSLA